jgi:hypothetical protein
VCRLQNPPAVARRERLSDVDDVILLIDGCWGSTFSALPGLASGCPTKDSFVEIQRKSRQTLGHRTFLIPSA